MSAALLTMALTARLYLPVFGPGSLTNLGDGDMALTNASAHVGWSVALPLAGYVADRRRGLLLASVAWMVGSLAQEAFFHAPASPGPRYAAEVRTDLVTRLGPTVLVLLVMEVTREGGP